MPGHSQAIYIPVSGILGDRPVFEFFIRVGGQAFVQLPAISSTRIIPRNLENVLIDFLAVKNA